MNGQRALRRQNVQLRQTILATRGFCRWNVDNLVAFALLIVAAVSLTG
ncbi:hypothetical protein ACLB1Q_26950 [Escherichia coli]